VFVEPALFVASFNSEDPGALQVAQRCAFFLYFRILYPMLTPSVVLGLPPDIVGATLGDLGVEEVAGLESQVGIPPLPGTHSLADSTAASGQHRNRDGRVPEAVRPHAALATNDPASASRLRERAPLRDGLVQLLLPTNAD